MIISTNYLIIYHKSTSVDDCPDGICGAWVIWKYLKEVLKVSEENIEVVGELHQKREEYFKESYKLPFNPSQKHLYIVDFSFPKELLVKIKQQALTFTLYDHHVGNFNDISDFHMMFMKGKMNRQKVKVKYSENEKDCGATIAWKELFGHPLPWFLKHVFARDTGTGGFYDGDMPESEAIGEAMSHLRKGLSGKESFPVFEKLLNYSETDIEELKKFGKSLLQERDDLVNQEILSWLMNPVYEKFLFIEHLDIPVLRIKNPKADRYYSWIGSILARRFPNIFVAVVCTTDQLAYALRANSKSPMDCSMIAKYYGGGGHKNAAGMRKHSMD